MAQKADSDRAAAWLPLVALAQRVQHSVLDLERRKRARRLLVVTRAQLVVVRFARAAAERRALHRAADLVLYVATLVRAQSGFRTACRRLVWCVSRAQKCWRQRARCVADHARLLVKQWERQDFREPVPERFMLPQIAEFAKDERRQHVLRQVVYEKYELRPILVETLVRRANSRTAARESVERSQKYGTMLRLATQLKVDLGHKTGTPPPHMRRLATRNQLQDLQTNAARAQDSELRQLLMTS